LGARKAKGLIWIAKNGKGNLYLRRWGVGITLVLILITLLGITLVLILITLLGITLVLILITLLGITLVLILITLFSNS
jgi:hypothetical protein